MKPQEISNQKYLSLETLRKNNSVVQTPVWFVIYKDMIHVVTREDTGKIKRLRNNNKVRIALCNFKGDVKGQWVSGIVAFSSTEDMQKVLELRREKYGFIERIARFASRNKGGFIVFSIQLEEK